MNGLLVNDLASHIASHPESADLQISAFCAALQHLRKATIATPFPTHLFKTTSGDKDFKACLQALECLAPVSHMRAPASLQALPQPSVALLAWLLLPETRKQLLFHPLPPSAFAKQLQQVQPGVLPPQFEANEAPSAIFALDRPSSSTARRPVVAYHGTAMENLHSILNTGLINASGTRLQRTGAAFGDGIYLSTRHSVAYSFSRPSDSWKKSALGTKMRCLLVCEVDMDKIDEDSSTGPHGSNSGVGNSSDVPDDYLLVSRTDAIRLLHVLLFCDAPPLAALQEVPHGRVRRRTARTNWCSVLVFLYALGMLISGALANKSVQIQLKLLWRRLQQMS